MGLAALDPPYNVSVSRRSAYTLLEVILAMALTIVILGLVTMAVHVNLGVAGKSRSQVEEAQLARALLQRVAEDLRNALPLVMAEAAPSESAYSTSTSTETAAPTSGGIFGTARELWIETSHRPRAARSTSTPADGTQPARLSDIRSVSYSLGRPSTTSPGEQSDPTEGGFYRRDVDRAAFQLASEQGQVDALDQAAEALAPEVVDLKFTYYDGTTASDQWDSAEQGKLPTAVRAAISIRRAVSNRTGGGASDPRPPVVYSMLVEVPSAATSSQGEAGNGSAK